MKVEESLNVSFDESPPPTKLSPLVDDDVGEEEAIKRIQKLVAQGYNQQEGIDYDETYAPVARLESIRILLAIACANDFKLYQMNVKSAFLYGFINKEVYVAQPLGFIDFQKPNYVYKLKKALYGLKQAPKAWYDRLKAFLIKHEYSTGMVNNIIFTNKSKSHLIIVQIYVDDIIFGSTSQNLCDDFAKIMHDEFEMSMMGELNFFLGLQIKQMEDGIFFNQSKYIKEMLKKFGLEDSKPTKTPMSTEIKLTKDDEADSVDSSKYRGMIGSLLYLTASRPDIMFSVCLCARFQENPKTTHLEAVKRIFRYIRGTSHLGLWYPKGTRIETIVYADSDHAGDYVDRKSTSGVCTFMGCCLTSWFAKKQTALAISTTKAEYVSAGKACQQALWMKQALIDYDIRLDDVPIISKLGQFTFKLTSSQLSRIFQTPYTLETFYTSEWSLNSLDDHPNSNFFGPQHDLVKNNITIPRTTQTQLQRNTNKLHIDDIRPDLKGWELFFRENFFCSLGKRNRVNACTIYMLYYLIIKIKFNFTSMIIYRMKEVKNKQDGPMPFAMLLTHLYNHILQTNPQAIVPLARFTFYERVMDPLDISRNPSKEKGKRIASPLATSSSSSSSDDNEGPSFLEFYDEISDNEDLTKAQ
ncbi:retrovirus-related pol polyprotein from transposon TNT 1-94 [Tanacetum coccineum]